MPKPIREYSGPKKLMKVSVFRNKTKEKSWYYFMVDLSKLYESKGQIKKYSIKYFGDELPLVLELLKKANEYILLNDPRPSRRGL